MARDTQETLSKFALTGDDLKKLKRAAELVMPILDDALAHFYSFAVTDPEIAQFFPDEGVMEHARGAQKKHWQRLLSGSFDDDYLASAERVGSVHFKIQLPFAMYLSGYSRASAYIQQRLLERAGPLVGKYAKRRQGEILGVLTRAFAFDTYQVIAAYFAAQKAEQDTAFRYLSDGISRMSARDLSSPIPGPEASDFPARYDEVRQSFNGLMSSMGEVIMTIQDATGNLNRIASEVNQSAEDLSRRTETQAATLEQTAAAVEEINHSVQSSTESTSSTEKVVLQTRQNAARGNDVAEQAVTKMREISESSAQISQIIGVIDDIAFQTNLLALNAGVEAARAGEAGRGFAVVASEVRGLAQRAADSAKEIKALVSTSTQHVDNGVEMVDQAGTALTDIVKDIEKVSTLTADIVNSAREQSTGLSEIATGVSQLDQVTQQNAAMVEETAAAIMSLQTDTQVLSELVGTFKTAGGGNVQRLPKLENSQGSFVQPVKDAVGF
jgi:methyl-accepting chemotaxis protein